MGKDQSTAERCGHVDDTGVAAPDRPAIAPHLTVRWRQHAGERFQQRALAGAVRPQDADGLAADDGQVDLLQR
jgi:hypothetical protein